MVDFYVCCEITAWWFLYISGSAEVRDTAENRWILCVILIPLKLSDTYASVSVSLYFYLVSKEEDSSPVLNAYKQTYTSVVPRKVDIL